MTRRGVKQEKPQAEDVEEVFMPSTMKPKKKARADANEEDLEMNEAPSFSNNSFPAMPTPSSVADDGLSVANINGMQRVSGHASQYFRSAAPSAETSLHIVGNRVQVLINAIQDFRVFGVDHVVQLPELVLVGDQSAGKSSLMGALAEIHLPQSAGCCTRCPAHIKTTPADIWTCKISLEREYNYEPRTGRPIDSRDVTKSKPFPPWNKQQDLEVKHFTTIDDKSELEEALKWAQIATLNHSKHHSQYVPGHEKFSNDESTEAKFSPNVVSVEISGPGLVPLSFYDLPGIFQNAGQKEDQYLVKVVENLAMKYIGRPQALIICALPMSADPATSRTAKVIVDQNAASRCIGVLTKADQLQEGQSVAEFGNMLKGLEYQLGYGYYVTKQPGPSAGLAYNEYYHAKARADEAAFFSSQWPWNEEWSEFRSRFGTTNLAQALSQNFAAQIVKSIPEIETKINRRAIEIDNQLKKLPEIPSKDIVQTVAQCLVQFSANVQNLLDGDASYNNFHSSWQKLCNQFRETILEMKPRIKVRDDSDSITTEVISIDDDSDGSMFEGRKRMNDETPTPKEKKRKYEQSNSTSFNTVQSNETDVFSSPFALPQHDGGKMTPRMNGTNHLALRTGSPNITRTLTFRNEVLDEAPNPFAEYLNIGKNFIKIGGIRNLITQYSRTGVPGIVNDRVHSDMCMQSVTPWESPLEKMIDISLKMLRDQAEEILNDALSTWQQTQLFKQSRLHLNKFFDELETSQRADATALYELETYRLFTVNTIAWEEYRQEEGLALRKMRKIVRARAYVNNDLKMRRKTLDDAALRKAISEVKDEQLGKDPFETEIEVAAYVRGYYRTAALRFVDGVCLSVHGKLFRNARKEIFYFLEKQLGLDTGNGEQRCRELMEENAQVADRRAKLKKEKESLNKFTQRLYQLAEDNKALDAQDADADSEMV